MMNLKLRPYLMHCSNIRVGRPNEWRRMSEYPVCWPRIKFRTYRRKL